MSQIFLRMEISAEEKAEILQKLKTEHGGQSFSNVNRQMWGLEAKNRSESMRDNKNANKNFGKSAKDLLNQLTNNGTKKDSHAIEKRFMELLNRFDDFDLFERLLNDFKKLFQINNVYFNKKQLETDTDRIFDDETDEVKREWARGFWGTNNNDRE